VKRKKKNNRKFGFRFRLSQPNHIGCQERVRLKPSSYRDRTLPGSPSFECGCVVFYYTITIFTTPHQLGKKKNFPVFLSRQFYASPPTDDGGLRDFYHNWTNSILQQMKRKLLEIYLGSTFGSCFGDGYRSTCFARRYRRNRR
jgi:hypothetical protein